MRSTHLVLSIVVFILAEASVTTASAEVSELNAATINHTSDDIQLESVKVTAQRRVERIEDVPISISVVEEEDLKNSSAHKLADMQQLVPNFNVVQYGVANSISIRGIGSGGRNIGFDTRAGVYLDGIYMGQVPALESPLFEIEQIEVLRGPQGYLFGRNSDAGAVNITTRGPSDTFEGYYRTGFGNYHSLQNYASVSGPINDQLKGKLSIGAESHDGFVTNLFNNTDLKDLNRFAARGQLAYQVNDQLNVDFSADYSKIRQADFEGAAVTGLFDVPLPNGPDPKDRVNFNTQPSENTRLSGVSLKANYEMLNGNMVTGITGYRSTFGHALDEIDKSPIDLVHTNFKDDFKQFSQEVRIASPIKDPVRYVAGVFYLHENSHTNRAAIFGQDTSTLVKLPTIPVFLPFDSIFGIAPNAQIPFSGKVKTDSYALFGSIDDDITDKVTLHLGARYTFETKDLIYSIDGSQGGALGFPTLSNFTDHRQDNDFSPMVGLTYALSKNLNVYGKYSTGFKSGGWNVDFLSAAQVADHFAFNKETVENYEVGAKGNALNNRLQYDVSVFLSDYKDFQVFQFVDVGAGQTIIQLRNAAKAQSKGLEASMNALVTDHFKLGANIGLLDARFRSFPNGGAAGVDAAGQHLPDAPEVTAAITCNYTIFEPSLGGKFDLYGETTYRSKSYSAINNDQSISNVSSRELVNARLSYTSYNQHWQLSAWARNLFDKTYTTARGKDFFGNQFVRYGDPRTYGLEAQYNF